MKGTAALVALLALLALTRSSRADDSNAQRLSGFIVDACEYYDENRGATAEQAHLHFGTLIRKETVTAHVDKPHPLFHVRAKRLPGWAVSIEDQANVNVAVPRSVRITVHDLERYLGEADTDDEELRVPEPPFAGGWREPVPARFVIGRLGTSKGCSVIVFGDGKSGVDDWHRQRVMSVTISD